MRLNTIIINHHLMLTVPVSGGKEPSCSFTLQASGPGPVLCLGHTGASLGQLSHLRREWWLWRSSVGSAPAALCQRGTWRARRAWQAGRPGRGGCERARPLRARSASRASLGRLRREASREPAAFSPAAGVALCGSGSESHLPAAERQGRGSRRRKRRRGKRRRRKPTPPGGAHLPGALQSPAFGLLEPPARPPSPRPPPPARPPAHTAAAAAAAPPGRSGPAIASGADREFEASAGRAGPPRCAREPPRHPSSAEQPRARCGRPERASEEERRDPEKGSERERASLRESAGNKHHARLEEEYPNLLAGRGAGERVSSLNTALLKNNQRPKVSTDAETQQYCCV
ncbi:uncharacterized protein PS065_006498 [Dugong dugon]